MQNHEYFVQNQTDLCTSAQICAENPKYIQDHSRISMNIPEHSRIFQDILGHSGMFQSIQEPVTWPRPRGPGEGGRPRPRPGVKLGAQMGWVRLDEKCVRRCCGPNGVGPKWVLMQA